MPNSSHLIKKTWLLRAIETHNYHCRQLKLDPRWSQSDSAAALGRSTGSVSEDILIASWMRTHEDQLKKFKYAKDAIAFIREKEKTRHYQEIEMPAVRGDAKHHAK